MAGRVAEIVTGLAIVGVWSLTSLPAASAQAAAPSVAMTAQRLRLLGARTTVNLLVKHGRWEAVIDQVAAGRADWIALTPELGRGTDAGTSESLSIALASALPKASTAVMRVLTPTSPGPLGVRQVCSAPFIEETVKDIPVYRRRTAAALARVNDPRLRGVRNACLRALERG